MEPGADRACACPHWNFGLFFLASFSFFFFLPLLPDESKTCPFLSSFFKNIFGLKVQFDAELWSFHLNLLFFKNIKEISRIRQKKKSKNQHGARKGPMSQRCFRKFPMLRHIVEKVLEIWQCRDIS